MTVPYFPLDDRPFRLRMGLRPLDLAEWLEPDEHAPAELALKARLVAERSADVVALVDAPGVHEACEELWSLVDAATPRVSIAEVTETVTSAIESEPSRSSVHPIVRCGLATQEDWAVMAPVGGHLVLAAACVCFPTRWVLRTKIGRPMAEVHEHVAHYDEHLSTAVDRFFERITVDRPVWRLNWNLMDDPALFQPVAAHAASAGPNPRIDAANAGARIWLRIERQTLRRLPETGAVAFGIRVHQRPLAALANEPGRLATLRVALANLPADTFAYKGLGAFSEALHGWLAGIAD